MLVLEGAGAGGCWCWRVLVVLEGGGVGGHFNPRNLKTLRSLFLFPFIGRRSKIPVKMCIFFTLIMYE